MIQFLFYQLMKQNEVFNNMKEELMKQSDKKIKVTTISVYSAVNIFTTLITKEINERAAFKN